MNRYSLALIGLFSQLIRSSKEEMTSRERILAAIEHKAVDRVPLFLWIEPHTILKIANLVKEPQNLVNKLLFKLLSYLHQTLPTHDLREGCALITWLIQQNYLLELGVDMVDFAWSNPLFWYKGMWVENGKFRIKDMYGMTHGIVGLYLEILDVPCKTKKELDNYQFPDLSSPIHYEHIRRFRKKYPNIAIACRCPGMQDWGHTFCTLEKFYTWMIDYPKVMKRFFNKLTEHSLQIIKGALTAGADVIIIGDDYGTQESMFISYDRWCEFTYPCLKRQIETIHSYGGKALLHSDGYIMPLLDKLVEARLDALHPFQPVPKNNLKLAKRKYGKKLCFVTGIDVQRLPLMKKKEVRKSIVNTYKIAAKDGGFILATTNMLQVDTSISNLKEMFATIEDIKKGKYD